MFNVFKVTATVDSALRVSMKMASDQTMAAEPIDSEEVFFVNPEMLLLGMHASTLMSIMDEEELRQFLLISKRLGFRINVEQEIRQFKTGGRNGCWMPMFKNPNEIRFNDTLANTCSVFEYDGDDVVGMVMWSAKEESLLNFIKMVKQKFDKNDEILIVKSDDGTWNWSVLDYTFTFDSEFKAYTDAISYLKSVEALTDYFEPSNR